MVLLKSQGYANPETNKSNPKETPSTSTKRLLPIIHNFPECVLYIEARYLRDWTASQPCDMKSDDPSRAAPLCRREPRQSKTSADEPLGADQRER